VSDARRRNSRNRRRLSHATKPECTTPSASRKEPSRSSSSLFRLWKPCRHRLQAAVTAPKSMRFARGVAGCSARCCPQAHRHRRAQPVIAAPSLQNHPRVPAPLRLKDVSELPSMESSRNAAINSTKPRPQPKKIPPGSESGPGPEFDKPQRGAGRLAIETQIFRRERQNPKNPRGSPQSSGINPAEAAPAAPPHRAGRN